jgi:hypothetical protein
MPNPWVAFPVLVATIAGGAVGWFVTDASCAPDSCDVMAGSVAAIAAIGTGIGVGVVVVLALKSLAEWREHGDREITVRQDGPPTC